MHRLATIPGGWNPAAEGVIFVEQQPAPIAFITAADTDIQTLAVATTQLSVEFPQVRVVNLLQLQQQLTIDTYAEDVLTAAKVIIVHWGSILLELWARSRPGDCQTDGSGVNRSTRR
jgi:cobaltochelatase CobN